jgi:hypothetical protein
MSLYINRPDLFVSRQTNSVNSLYCQIQKSVIHFRQKILSILTLLHKRLHETSPSNYIHIFPTLSLTTADHAILNSRWLLLYSEYGSTVASKWIHGNKALWRHKRRLRAFLVLQFYIGGTDMPFGMPVTPHGSHVNIKLGSSTEETDPLVRN